MRKLKRFTSAFIGLSVLFTLNTIHSFADSDSTYDEHTVNSDEHLISEKQRLAEQMYEAVVSENYNLASQYRYEINQPVMDTLLQYAAHHMELFPDILQMRLDIGWLQMVIIIMEIKFG